MRVLPDRHVGPLQAGRRSKSRHARLRIHPSARLRGWTDTDADVDTNADADGHTHTDTNAHAHADTNRDTNAHRDADSVAHWGRWRGDSNAHADSRGAGAHDTGS